jgi:hypothetical protein
VAAGTSGCGGGAANEGERLHWLYTRGILVGWSLIALGGLLGILAAAAATVLRARRRARRAREGLGRVSDSVAGTDGVGRSVVRGVLDENDAGVVVRMRDGDVRLEGEVLPVEGGPVGRLGERVRALGRLTHEASDTAATGYRSAGVRPKMVGTTWVVAERGPYFVRPRLRWLAVGAVLGTLLGATSVALAAAIALARGEAREDSGLEASPTALAAISPWGRTAALRQLAQSLSRGLQTDERLERREAALILLDECREAIALWWGRGRYERAESAAARCGARLDGMSYFRMGEFALASDAFADAPSTLTVCAAHIAAHKYARAATSVVSLAANARGDREQALGCIADALAARDGDANAERRLAEAAGERAMCRVLYADLLGPGEKRLALLGDWEAAWAWRDNQGMDFSKGRVVQTANRLKEEVKGTQNPAVDDYTLFPSAAWQSGRWESEHRSDVPIALLHRLEESGAAASQTDDVRITVAGNLALFYARLGEQEAAERELLTVKDVRGRQVDGASIEQVLARLREKPTLATRWSGTESPGCEQCGLYVAMDDVATRRNEAKEHGDVAAEAELGVTVRRFRDAALDSRNAVPLHMLEGFNLP